MARARRRKILGLGATLALAIAAIAIVLPMALASTVVDAGTLRLHLSGSDYFKYQLPGGTSGGQQTLGATNCELRSTGDVLASLSPTPSSAKVGLTSHGLGVKTSIEGTTGKCGEVNAPSEVLTLKIPSTGPLVGKHFDYAELDIEINYGARVNMALYDNGSQVDASPGNASTLNLVVNCVSSPSSCGPVSDRNYRIRVPSAGSVQFDEIRMWAAGSSSKSSIELEGGDAPWLPGGLGASLGTKDSVFHVVSAGPDLSVSKTPYPADASLVSVGDQVGFEIKVSNASGAGTASNVAVADTLPTGLDWSIASQDGTACPTDLSGGSLTCTIPTLAGGSSYAVRITAPATAQGMVTNDGVVVSIGDTTVATADPASVEVQAPGLSVTKTADASSVQGGVDPVGFTITVTNSGPGKATGVLATDLLPTDTGLGWSIDSQGLNGATDGTACPTDLSSGTLTCTIGTLAADDRYAVHITSSTSVDTVLDSPIDNTVSVTSSNGDPDPIQASASIFVGAGVLDCNQPATDTPPDVSLTRGDNANPDQTCEKIDYTLTRSGGTVTFLKDLTQQSSATFTMSIAWDPEADVYPPTQVTQVDFGTGLHTVQWCDGTSANPVLPSGELVCLTSESAVVINDTQIQVTSNLYIEGDLIIKH
jgi:uncharacterized repeat protein (TIGR01451 family)